MTERQLLTDFTKIIKKVPGLFWYKIPDTYGGQKKPFDVFAVYRGRPICIEFKKGGKLEEHQEENLREVKEAGGISLIGNFYKTVLNPNTERNLYFIEYPKKEKDNITFWGPQYKEGDSKEPYPKVQEFLDWSIQL